MDQSSIFILRSNTRSFAESWAAQSHCGGSRACPSRLSRSSPLISMDLKAGRQNVRRKPSADLARGSHGARLLFACEWH